MKSYCKNCEQLQPSTFRPGRDVVTNDPYEDLCCDSCHYIVATIQGRDALAQEPAQQEDRSAANNFGRPYGYAVVVATGKHAGVLDGGAHTFRDEAEKVIKDNPSIYTDHKVVPLCIAPQPAVQEPNMCTRNITKVERPSDQTLLLHFTSCAQASKFAAVLGEKP